MRFFELQLFAENIYGTSSSDYIAVKNPDIAIYGYGGNDTVYNGYRHNNITVSGGDGNDSIKSYGSSNVSIVGGAGHDKIFNQDGENAEVYGDSGNDSLYSQSGDYVYISGGSDNDTITVISGNNVTIAGDSDDDKIILSRYASAVVQYSIGDGNDVVTGFSDNDTLQISGGSYTTTESGKDIVVKVGSGSVILKDAKNVSLNIKSSGSSSGGGSSSSGIPSDAFYYNGHYYYLYPEVTDTWEEAKTYCEKRGGYLAIINNAAENAALFNYMKQSGYYSAYFGLSDSANEGTWKWVDGTYLNYSNWASGEPGGGSYENYATLYLGVDDGKWIDGDFNLEGSGNFICEWNGTGSSVNKISNYESYTWIYGTSGKDSVYNSGDYVDISTGKGNDYIYSDYTNGVSIYGGSGSDTIDNYAGYGNDGNWATIKGGSGKDSIRNFGGDSVISDGGSGNDKIYDYGHNNTIYGGTGRDYIYLDESKYALVFGGKGNDTIISGSGDITGDTDHATISGGKGNDKISLGSDSYNNVIQYASGDGKDTIYGFNYDDVLHITSGSYKTKVSGDDVVVTVGKGKIVLKDAVGRSISIEDSEGEITTKNYGSSSSNVTWLFAENNFVTNDNLSEIVKNNLSPTSLEKIETNNFENLTQENNLITFSEK